MEQSLTGQRLRIFLWWKFVEAQLGHGECMGQLYKKEMITICWKKRTLQAGTVLPKTQKSVAVQRVGVNYVESELSI